MGTIPTHIIEQVAAANDIVEVIGSYFPLKRAGLDLQGALPVSSGEDTLVSRSIRSGRYLSASAAALAAAFSVS